MSLCETFGGVEKRRLLGSRHPIPTPTTRVLPHKIKGVQQIPCPVPHPWQRVERKTARDELDDRCRVVRRVIDIATLGIRRAEERRDACAWPPAVTLGRRDMIPEATIFIVGHDDHGA